MMAKRDADLTSADKNEVLPSRTFIFHPGGVLLEFLMGCAARDIKIDPFLELCDH